MISSVMLGLAEVFTYFELGKETIQNIFLVIALGIIAKPFGELTASIFKLNIK